MKIVVLDGHTLNPGDNPWDALERLGELRVFDRTPEARIIEHVGDAPIVVTNKAPLRAETIAQLPALRYIAVTATGYNIVDVEAAAKRGIPVSNVPDYATDSVAQLTIALLLELCHRVGLHDASVKAGEWERSPDFSYSKSPLVELAGKTFGIIGFGKTGQATARVAHALGMKLIAFNPSKREPPEYPGFQFVSLDQLFSRADVVSLHCPATPSNQRMVNREQLSRMKRSAMLINTARGQLIDEADLAEALNSGAIAGAAVDVLSVEPPAPTNPLLTAKNIVITPHIAWAAVEPRRRVTEITAQNVAAFIEGKPKNVVNMPKVPT